MRFFLRHFGRQERHGQAGIEEIGRIESGVRRGGFRIALDTGGRSLARGGDLRRGRNRGDRVIGRDLRSHRQSDDQFDHYEAAPVCCGLLQVRWG